MLQDAVRGDFNELSKLLIDHGGKVWSDGQVHQTTAFGPLSLGYPVDAVNTIPSYF